jgi:acyl transferase domain-containing protein/acyl-CoA synthetase (AMP-forming)/AMP-acid ligase II/acyl carrier protein/SAM-dependent methyltransferase
MQDSLDLATSSLVALLQRRSEGRSASKGYTFLPDGDEAEFRLTFADLEHHARRLAGALLENSRRGERAILFFPAGLEFLKGLFGCLFAGVIGVPVAYQRLRKPNPALTSIVADSGATLLITTDEILADRERFLQHNAALAGLRWISVNHPTDNCAREAPAFDIGAAAIAHGQCRPGAREPFDPSGVAFLQYTSGSTGSPKGVCLTHRALLHNLLRMQELLHLLPEECVGVTWLPAYHDMGLIGHILQVVHTGADLVLMSPMAFVQKPLRWLRAISRYRATITCGPNFAFELCTRQIKPRDCEGLDLGSWQVACIGAEPIAPRVLDEFTTAFEPFGFRREVFYPCYGLAESTLMVTGGHWQATPVLRSVVRSGLENEMVVPAVPGDPDAKEVVGCGRPVPDLDVRIVDPVTAQACAPDRIGEIWVAGPSVAAGYWGRPHESEQVFRARIAGEESNGYLRTGDLGFFLGGELFVAGRLKDMINIRGRKLYPQDVEQIVTEAHPALRGCDGAAFSIDADGKEELIVVHEVDRHNDPKDRDSIIDAIQSAIAESFALTAQTIAILRFNGLPKTSSGKVRRQECRRLFLIGDLDILWSKTAAAGTPPHPPFGHPPSGGARDDGAENELSTDKRHDTAVTPPHPPCGHPLPGGAREIGVVDDLVPGKPDAPAVTPAHPPFGHPLPGGAREIGNNYELSTNESHPAAVTPAHPPFGHPLPGGAREIGTADEVVLGELHAAAEVPPHPPCGHPLPGGARENDVDGAAPGQPQRSRHEIRGWLVRRLADHLKCDEGRIDPSRPFAAFGLDSVTMVGISGELQSWIGRELPPTLLYDAPNIDALVRALTPDERPAEASPGQVPPGHEPIAIVGMGCHFPGAGSPEELWQLLKSGVDAIGTIPNGRWPKIPGEIATTCGGFLEAVDQFDAPFFGISPREAAYLDPQHRLLLEVTWEALEDAGLPAEKLAGESVGVFVGISGNDYGRILAAGPGLDDAYSVTGNSASMAANRVSYHFDFRGPSLAVDTACSSSLVAVHLACESIRRGECQVALAAGVNVMLTPEVSVTLSRAMMLSPTGRCRAFDASADGYVRGEGCGVIVLKPLRSALESGDRVLALVLGSAVNQDGKSNGITAPNGQAQTALIRAALADAGIAPEQVGYVESHGTGTVLGDPIEFSALKAALSPGSSPCAVSTVKTNLGHLESAGGIAGLLKAVLQLRHGAIAPHLHLKKLNPLIDLAGTRFFIPSELKPWPRRQSLRIAGVSSFGFGGSNAHVVLAEAPAAVEPTVPPVRRGHLLTLSAHTESALREIASRYHDFLIEDATADVAQVTFTASAGRSHRAHRLAIRGHDLSNLASGLTEFLTGQSSNRIQVGRATGAPAGGVAFLFTGQGSQRMGMGRMLYECCTPFREAIARCETILAGLTETPLEGLLDADDRKSAVRVQTALFAIEFALAETWRSWGIEPTAVLGHSLGEYVAACVAGVFSLEDALQLVVGRARLMEALPDSGAMAAVLAPLANVEQTLSALGNPVDVAAVNGPEQIILSGDRDALRSIREAFRRDRIATHALDVSRAFHSRQIDPILDELETIAANVRFQPPRIPIVSNVSGRPAGAEIQTASYWRRHARETVLFQGGIEWLVASGVDVFLEVGPTATLSSLARSFTPARDALWLPSLRGGSDEWSELLDAVSGLYVCGAAINWREFGRPFRGRLISLPTYPFERSRHWVDLPETHAQYVPSPAAQAPEKMVLDSARWVPRSRWEIPGGRFASTSLCDLSQIAASVEAESIRSRVEEHRAERHDLRDGSVRKMADRFAAAHVQRAFRELGWVPSAGDNWTTEALGQRLGIKSNFHRLLGRMLEMLAEDGSLRRDGDRWQALAVSWDDLEPGDLLGELLARQPDHEPELTLADHCGRRLGDVLRGKIDPLLILFPDGSPDRLARIYGEAPTAQAGNRLIAETIARGFASLPADRIVRIVEIGAGTGGTTSHILPRLPRGRCEYVFTDISSLFINHASERFREHPFVQYHPLDIERDPAESGFAPHQFDIVLAANVLHATPDLKRSLAHVRQLLAPRGWLILLEGTARERILDLVFGLTAGWWKYADLDLRPDYPLISRESWQRLFLSEGFTDAGALAATVDSHQVVFVARAPSTVEFSPNRSDGAARSWRILADQPGIAAGLAERLAAGGARCSIAFPGAAGEIEPSISRVSPCQCGDIPGTPCVCGSELSVVDLRRLGEPAPQLSRETTLPESSSWIVTRGQDATGEQVSSPMRWVDLDPALSVESSLDQLARELLDPGDEPFVAFRDGDRFVAARDQVHTHEPPLNGDTAGLIPALRSALPAERGQRILDSIRSELARTLRLPAHAIEPDRPMVGFGLDSLMAIQLKNRLEELTGVSISVVKLLEGLTVLELAALIDEAMNEVIDRPEAANGFAENGFAENGHHETALLSPWDGETMHSGSRVPGEAIDGIDDLSESELDLLIDDLLITTDEHD